MARLTFLGAARTVTGSQYLLEAGSSRLMVDCGMFQGERALRERNWAAPVSDPALVRWLVLTHAHLDHTGRVPRLVKQGFRGPIYCTPASRELAEVLLKDAAHLQEEDAAYLNRKGLTRHKPALPLFDTADVEACLGPAWGGSSPYRSARPGSSPWRCRSPSATPATCSAPPPWTWPCAKAARPRACCSAATWAGSTPSWRAIPSRRPPPTTS
jgi:metallo-beta-lactamase family protein